MCPLQESEFRSSVSCSANMSSTHLSTGEFSLGRCKYLSSQYPHHSLVPHSDKAKMEDSLQTFRLDHFTFGGVGSAHTCPHDCPLLLTSVCLQWMALKVFVFLSMLSASLLGSYTCVIYLLTSLNRKCLLWHFPLAESQS